MNGDVVCAECRQVVARENTVQYGDRYVCAACKPTFVQRLREGAALPLGEGEVVYAGFWIRVGASIVDGILFEIITLPIVIWVYGWKYYWDSEGFVAGPVDLLLSWIFPAIATVAFWMIKQATPGKMLVRARIVDARTGERPSLAQFIVRYLMYFVSLVPLGLGFIWVAFDAKKQGWHDKVARTVVIRVPRGK